MSACCPPKAPSTAATRTPTAATRTSPPSATCTSSTAWPRRRWTPPTGVTGPVPRSCPVDVSVTFLVTLLGVRVMCVVRRCGCGSVEGAVNEVGEEWVVGSVCGWMEEVGKGVGGVG